ncbi:putative ferric-chelate reductase 1 [Pygocentrus nattereri]|uniref:putative ferric-chelate reductase 1 n=1 Tax=Pygocentrus nattereri TaxID=42514 RepID=UPI0008145AA0|nr:putative ferric-chelate reductase 1 [Pygocentrus nattereri]
MEAKLLVFIAIMCAVSRIEGQTVLTSSSINITKSGCGTSKLCFPSCDPVVNSSTCYFGSTQYLSNGTLNFELRGPTSGYVALGLASDPNVGATIVFVCATNNNSNTFFFQTASNTTSGLNQTTVNTVYTVLGSAYNQSLNQSFTQCTFNTSSNLTVGNMSTSTSKASTNISYYVTIFSGTTNGATLGFPVSQYFSGKALNLADPTSNTNTTSSTSSTTAAAVAATTASGSDSLTNPVAHALAILLSAIGLLHLS